MHARKSHQELTQLKNLGPTIIKKLGEIGIYSEDDLRKIGPAKAYLLMQENAENKLPVCYYLYSLAGALENTHWNDLADAKKKKLLSAIGRSQK